MAQLLINIGESVNDKRGDPLRTAFDKVNQNFTELFTTDTSTKYHLGDDVQFVDIDPDSGMVVIQSGYNTGMPVYIKGGNCADGGVGGNVVIEAGGAPLGIDNFINGTTGNVEISGQDVTIEAGGGITTFGSNGAGDPTVIFPADSYGDQLGVQGGGIEGINSIALVALNGRAIISTVNANNTTGLGWQFDQLGTLYTPILFPVTFTAVFDAEHKTEGPIALTDTAWEVEVQFQSNPNGEINILLNAIINPSNPGYTDGDTFSFTEADHGIQGYILEISLTNITNAGGPGPSPWTANAECTQPPAYTPTIYSDGAIKLSSTDNNSWTFGTDGDLTLPGAVYVTTGLDGGIIGTNGLNIVVKHAQPLSLEWSLDGETNIYADNPEFNTNTASIGFGINGVNIEVNNLVSGGIWTFGPDGKLRLPIGGDIVDRNGNSVLGGGSGSTDRLVAGDKSVILDTDGDLTLPAGGEIKSAAGTGDVVIEANDGTARTWTFGGDGTLTAPYGKLGLATGEIFGVVADADTAATIQSNGGVKVWGFGIDGTLTLPTATDNANIYRAGSIGIKTDGLAGGQQWTYDDTGKLTFPDTHLTIENSTIGRKVVTIFDDGIVHTEDAEGSRLVFTDTSTSLETYSDPDGVNNTMMARHYTNGAATAGLEVYTEVVSGHIGTSLEVTSGGVTITSSDGVIDNTWNFDFGGDLIVPGRIKQQDQPTEINLNTGGVGNILISTNTDFDTHLLLSPGAGAALSANVAVSLSAGVGISAIHQAYLDAEALWEVARDEDAAMIVPLTRPWAGYSGYNAWPIIFGYEAPPGYDFPPNFISLSQACRTAKYAWDDELTDTNVNINAQDKTWTFGTDGKFLFPSGAGFLNGDSGQLKTDAGSTTSLDFRDGTGRGFYTNSDGFSLRSNGSNTWKFDDGGAITLPNGSKLQTYSGGSTGLTSASGGIVEINANGGNKTWSFSDTGKLTTPGEIWTKAGDGIQGLTFSPNGSDASAFIKVDTGQNCLFQANGNIYLRQGSSDRLSISNTNTTLSATNNVRLSANGSGKVWVFGTGGNVTLPQSLGTGHADIFKDSVNVDGVNAGVRLAWDMYQAAEAGWRSTWSEENPSVDITTRPWYNVPSYAVLQILADNWIAQQLGEGFSTPAISANYYNQLRAAANVGLAAYNSWIDLISTVEIKSANKIWGFGSDGVLHLPPGGDIVDSNSCVSVLTAKEPKFEMVGGGLLMGVTAGKRYAINTTTGPVTLTLPSHPETGDAIFFVDSHGTFSTNNLTIDGYGNNISGNATITISVDNDNVGLFYNGTEWRYYA